MPRFGPLGEASRTRTPEASRGVRHKVLPLDCVLLDEGSSPVQGAIEIVPHRFPSNVVSATFSALRSLGVAPVALVGGGRTPRLSRAREGLAYCWIEVLGRPGRPLAAVLGIRPQSVYRAAQRGRKAQAEWRRVLAK